MKTKILTTVLVLLSLGLYAQVGVNTDGSSPDGSAMLDVKSTDKGMLVPRMTTAQRTAISSPATGLLVFDTTTGSFWFYNGSWTDLSAADSDWTVSGNNIYSANTGNVGIGTNSPTAKLEIGSLSNEEGMTTALKLPTTGSSSFFRYGRLGTAPDAEVGFYKNFKRTVTSWALDDSTYGSQCIYFPQTGGLVFGTGPPGFGYSHRMTIMPDGKIGIGTDTPDTTLHIAGAIKIVDGSQGSGKVLVSDANGITAWSDPNDGLSVPDTTQSIPIRYHGSYIYVHPTDNATGTNWATAQSTCSGLTAHGHSDWYLPSLNELNAMYKQSFLITGLEEVGAAKYWSNTELDGSNAYTQRLDYGGPDPDAKTDLNNCRCIRKTN